MIWATSLTRLRWSFRVWLLMATLIGSGAAQNPRGSLQGEIQDVSGARVENATVTVSNPAISVERKIQANSLGEFRLDDLTPGKYHIVVNAAGFAPASADTVVVVSTVRDVLVKLSPAGVLESVSVSGEGASITTQSFDTTRTVQQGIISSQDLHGMPLAARSFANIAYLAPGTEPVEPSDPTKARITAVSFGGSSGLNVQLSVDGGDNSDDYIGGFLQNFSPDAIQEFAVKTSQEEADTGGTVGGAVVITTKHGTNEWHGSGAFYERASALNARFPIDNPEPQPKQPFSRQNYVATLGGPLKKEKLWIFGGFEAVRENASINYSPDSLTEFNALSRLAAAGLIQGVNLEGQPVGVSSIPVPKSVKVPFRDYIGTLRLDWAQSQKSQWFLRTSLDNYTTNNDLVQQATLPSTGATSGSKYVNTVISNQYAFGPRWLGAFTFDASFLHHTEARNQYLGLALAFPFSATFH